MKYRHTNNTSAALSKNANVAGYQNHMLDVLLMYIEKMPPIIGPMMKPSEKAMPTNAIDRPRCLISDTSVMTAMLKEMLPLLSPPTNRASTNIKKFDDTAHNTYEDAIPICAKNDDQYYSDCFNNIIHVDSMW